MVSAPKAPLTVVARGTVSNFAATESATTATESIAAVSAGTRDNVSASNLAAEALPDFPTPTMESSATNRIIYMFLIFKFPVFSIHKVQKRTFQFAKLHIIIHTTAFFQQNFRKKKCESPQTALGYGSTS